VEFLTDEQAAAYGRFVEEPTRPELERFFFLDDVDRDLVALRRTTAHQLGFAVQMFTVRYGALSNNGTVSGDSGLKTAGLPPDELRARQRRRAAS
jgi:hypothetical protein